MLVAILVGLLAVGLGLLALFAGYRLFLLLLPIWGFFAGFWLGAAGVSALFGGGFLATTTGIVVGLILGVVFAVLSYLFYFVGVIILGGTVGYWIVTGLLGAIGMDPGFLMTVLGLVGAVAAAGLMILFNLQKYLIIIITAFGGASTVLYGVMVMLGQIDFSQQTLQQGILAPLLDGNWLTTVIVIVLAVVGILAQLRTTSGYVLDTSKRASFSV